MRRGRSGVVWVCGGQARAGFCLWLWVGTQPGEPAVCGGHVATATCAVVPAMFGFMACNRHHVGWPCSWLPPLQAVHPSGCDPCCPGPRQQLTSASIDSTAARPAP